MSSKKYENAAQNKKIKKKTTNSVAMCIHAEIYISLASSGNCLMSCLF